MDQATMVARGLQSLHAAASTPLHALAAKETLPQDTEYPLFTKVDWDGKCELGLDHVFARIDRVPRPSEHQ
jgi:hypothetical protein